MDDYTFSPSDATATAGAVTISAPNTGQLVHELVLAKTDVDPGALLTTADGAVDEAKLEARGEDAGEIADVLPQNSKEGTFKLTPGRYVMFCNIPGHYAQGMYGTLTVKEKVALGDGPSFSSPRSARSHWCGLLRIETAGLDGCPDGPAGVEMGA
jgi:uncharacterized cupredoxin-like copper-binding protein